MYAKLNQISCKTSVFFSKHANSPYRAAKKIDKYDKMENNEQDVFGWPKCKKYF